MAWPRLSYGIADRPFSILAFVDYRYDEKGD